MASLAMEIGDGDDYLPLCPADQDGDSDDYLPLSPVEEHSDGDDYLPLSPVEEDGEDDDYLELSPMEEDGDDDQHLPPEQDEVHVRVDRLSNVLLRELRSESLANIIPRVRVTGAPDDSELALAAAVAEALETVEAPSDDIRDCPICLQDEDGTAIWKKTPCGHRFHGRCVERWLQAKGSCPMCRRQVVTMPAAVDATDAAYQELVRSDIFEAYGEDGVNSVYHGGVAA